MEKPFHRAMRPKTTNTNSTQVTYTQAMSSISRPRAPTPYFPIAKAIAPNAAMGAAFVTMPTMPKNICDTLWSKSVTGLAFSPILASTMPVRMAMKSTCKISPSAKALTKVFGMIAIRWPTTVWFLPFST